MRPITRGPSPAQTDYADYREAFGPLVGRLGCYCSYCERPMNTNLAVEHIQPKRLQNPPGVYPYAHLEGRWDNFLLGCVNCNSTKKDKDVTLNDVFLPDRDNTFVAFEYPPDGRVIPTAHLPAGNQALARATLALTGLDKSASNVQDENGQLVAVDRVSQRREIYLIAERARDENLAKNDVVQMREQIVVTARACGGFSIWMKVFEHDADMRRRLIAAFPGTANDCFEPVTYRPASPRPPNGLPYGGKL